ncbi:prepilin-type N-terminal cleavage/methylation domain-containing protein [Inhella sp.]|uniref:type IV pilus modification PilV family protein n=1 Tax=Inhella sp. TaxID=1921806 RepID=UPI0035B0C10C
MRNRRRGFTLVELILAIVVLGVGLAGVLLAFQQTTRSSADPLVNRQLLAIAEGMLEEVQSRPYSSSTPPVAGGCARSGFYDIDDYAGYSQGICTVAGVPVTGLAAYAVEVAVADVSLAGVPAKRITVTARRGAADSLQLVGWRTGYAP